MEDKHEIMGTEKITKLLIHFSLPAIIGMIANALYNIVDRIYIGNIEEVGHLAIAGVGLNFPVTIFVFGFAIFIGLGNATNVSLSLGNKNKDEAEKFLGTSLILGVLVSILIVILILLNLDRVVYLLGSTEKTFDYAKVYLEIVALGFPAVILGYIANAAIRADGSPKMSMITIGVSALINIILDPIFIFYYDMGIAGAAWATVISEYVYVIWGISYFFSKRSGIKIHLINLKLIKDKIIQIAILGSAPFAIQMGGTGVNFTYNNMLKIYGGDVGLGAMSIVQSVVLFLSMPVFGVNQGLQPILGYNYGAKLYERVKKALYCGIIFATIICIVNFTILQFFSHEIVKIFTSKADLLELASRGLRIQTMMLPIIGFQIISSVYFQAVGKPKMSMFISLSRQIVLLIPCILIMARTFGAMGIWYAGPTADFLATVVTFILIRKELRNLKEIDGDIKNI